MPVLPWELNPKSHNLKQLRHYVTIKALVFYSEQLHP